MKCKDFEQEIYGYRELTVLEKKAVDAHVLNCESCRELLTIVQQTAALISSAASVKPRPENFSKLTGNIIQALDKEQKHSASWPNSLFLRYAMVAASLSLILWFANEQHAAVELPHTPIADAVMLKSQPVSTILNQKKEKTISLYACAKSGDCKNSVFKTLKQRF